MSDAFDSVWIPYAERLIALGASTMRSRTDAFAVTDQKSESLYCECASLGTPRGAALVGFPAGINLQWLNTDRSDALCLAAFQTVRREYVMNRERLRQHS